MNCPIVYVSSDLAYYKAILNDTVQAACTLITTTATHFYVGCDTIYFVLPCTEDVLVQYLEAGLITYNKISVTNLFLIHMLSNRISYQDVVKQMCNDAVNTTMFHLFMNNLNTTNDSPVPSAATAATTAEPTTTQHIEPIVLSTEDIEDFEDFDNIDSTFLNIQMDLDDFAWMDDMSSFEVPLAADGTVVDGSYDSVIDEIIASNELETSETLFDNLINEIMAE
jgi:hypothetical protein